MTKRLTMTKRWQRLLGAWFLVLALAACGGTTTAPDGGGGGDEGGEEEEEQQQWELLLPDGTSIVGTSAEQTNDVTIVLSDSEPAGWSVTFVTDVPLSTAEAGYYDSQNVTNRVTGTVTSPSAQTCTAGPGATGGDKTFLTYAGLFDAAPAGQGGVVATCFGSGNQETYQAAFGAF